MRGFFPARPYRKALPHETVMTIMREEVAKGWWDRDLVEMLESARTVSPSAEEPAVALAAGLPRRNRS